MTLAKKNSVVVGCPSWWYCNLILAWDWQRLDIGCWPKIDPRHLHKRQQHVPLHYQRLIARREHTCKDHFKHTWCMFLTKVRQAKALMTRPPYFFKHTLTQSQTSFLSNGSFLYPASVVLLNTVCAFDRKWGTAHCSNWGWLLSHSLKTFLLPLSVAELNEALLLYNAGYFQQHSSSQKRCLTIMALSFEAWGRIVL